MELIKPAVDGTKNVLEACAATKGAVKRVVLTGSVASIYGKSLIPHLFLSCFIFNIANRTMTNWSVMKLG